MLGINDNEAVFLFSEINECASNPCRNGGTCMDAVASYTCECPPTWTDHRCDRGKLTQGIGPHCWICRSVNISETTNYYLICYVTMEVSKRKRLAEMGKFSNNCLKSTLGIRNIATTISSLINVQLRTATTEYIPVNTYSKSLIGMLLRESIDCTWISWVW